MIVKLVRYRVRKAEVPTVEAAIAEFVSAVAEHEPDSEYRTFRAPNGVSFVHLMEFPDSASEERHRGSAYTKAFVEVLYPRCDAGPTFTDLTELAGTTR